MQNRQLIVEILNRAGVNQKLVRIFRLFLDDSDERVIGHLLTWVIKNSKSIIEEKLRWMFGIGSEEEAREEILQNENAWSRIYSTFSVGEHAMN